MSTDRPQTPKRWSDEYASLVEAYVQRPSEDLLRRVSLLGGSLIENGVLPHDVAAAHVACSERLCARGAAGNPETLRAAGPLFLELMGVYSRAYQKQQELSRRLLSSSPAVVYSCGSAPDHRTTFISENVTTQSGYHPDEFYENAFFWTERIHPEDVDRILGELSQVDQHDHVSYEYRFRHKDGHYLWLHDELTPLRDAAGNVTELVGSWFDITERVQAEEALRESEARFRAIAENVPGVVYSYDVRPNSPRSSVYVGPGLSELLGEELAAELNGSADRFFELIHPDDREALSEAGERAVASGHLFDHVYRVRTGSGEYRWVRSIARPTQRGEGVVRWHGVLIDVAARKRAEEAVRRAHDDLEQRVEERTAELANANRALRAEIAERKRAEKALRVSEEKWRLLYDNLPGGSFIVNNQYIIEDVNAILCEVTGYSKEELIGQPCDIICPKGPHKCPVFDLGQERIDNSETAVKAKDGRLVPIIKSVRRIPVGDHEVIVENFQDISERKRVEEALRESERVSRAILDHTFQFIGLMRPDGVLIEANRTALDFAGIEESAVLGKPFWETPWWTHSSELQDRLRDAVSRAAAGHFVRFEATHPATDGTVHIVDFSLKPVRDEDGNVALLIPEGRDITERKRAEESLRESEEKLRSTLASISDLVFVLDQDGRFIDYHQPGKHDELYAPPEAFLGRAYADVLPAHVSKLLTAAIQQAVVTREPQPIDYPMEIRGERLWFSARVSARDDPHGDVAGVTVVTRNITERKQAEEALRESEARFRTLFEDIPVGVYRTTPDGRILDANPALVKMLGFPSFDELAKRSLEAEGFEPGYARRDFREQIDRDGTITLSDVAWTKQDGSVILARENATAVRDASGRVVHYDGTVEDITELKRSEELLEMQRDLGVELSATSDLVEAFDRLLEAVLRIDGIDCGDVYLVDERNGDMHLAAHKGLSSRFVERAARFGADSPEARVVRNGTPTYRSHARVVSGDELRRTEGHRAVAGIPVQHEGRVVAMLNLASRTRDEIPVAARPALEAVASRMGSVIARMRTTAALRESEERFRALVESTSDWVWEVDADGVYTYASPRVKDLLGYHPEEVIGRTPFDLMLPAEADRLASEFRTAVEAREPFARLENVNLHKDGRLVVLETSGMPFLDPDGRLCGYRGIDRDVTERKQAEEALRDSGERFRTVVDASKDAMVAIDREGLVGLFNPAAERMFERESEEVLGQPLDCLMPEEYRAPHREYVEQYFATGAPHGAIGRTLELSAIRRDGTVFPVELSLSTGRRGAEPFVLAVIRDITERKQAEDELRKFKTISDKATYGAAISDLEGNLTYVNDCFAEMHGYAPEELIGEHLSALHTQEQMPRVDALNDLLGRRGSWAAEEVWHMRRDGSKFPTLMSATIIKNESQVPLFFAATAIDITERKQAEETLRRQALVFDNVYDGVIVVDPQERISDWNPGAQRIFGYSKRDILGRPPGVLNRSADVADLTRGIHEGFARDGRWSGQVRSVRADGRERICEVVSVPLSDEEGRELGRVSVNRDITDRLRAEEEARRRQEELAHVSRLATMGEMATGLAHELNQPLSAILNYARGCKRRLRSGGCDFDEILGVTEKIAAQAERAGAFIERVRSFVRKGKPRFASVDINLLAREAVGFAEHQIRESGVKIEFQLGEPPPPILADMIQIEQVILNLVRNGIEAMQEAGLSERRLTLRTSHAGGEAIVFALEDSGCGFSEEAADKLFDAFFTTKPNGMGMGLAISRSIIERHGGRLWATPNPTGGTTFRFTLPVSRIGATL